MAEMTTEKTDTTLSEIARIMGRKGGRARAERMSAERRVEVATIASRRAAVLRTARAKQRARAVQEQEQELVTA